MSNNPLLPQDMLVYLQASAQQGATSPQLPSGYVMATPSSGFGPLLPRLFDASYITLGVIDPDRLGTGATGAGNLYLADDGTWKTIPTSGGGGGGTNSNVLIDGGTFAAPNNALIDAGSFI